MFLERSNGNEQLIPLQIMDYRKTVWLVGNGKAMSKLRIETMFENQLIESLESFNDINVLLGIHMCK